MAKTLPVSGCLVKHVASHRYGRVIAVRPSEEGTPVQVDWGSESEPAWAQPEELRSGFRPGDVVEDIPYSNVRQSLGTGRVLDIRELAGHQQLNVQLDATGETRWLAYERCKLVLPPTSVADDGADRFLVKVLAYSLDSWNQMTGALDRLDVDPLPHQIDLVHRILKADQRNWLIADDVGLGKTIEVGLLLAALQRRKEARRVLIVCPAGVVQQWKDEMQYKFKDVYQIYGQNFNIDTFADWNTYDKVIVSIDRAKMDVHSNLFRNSRDWDLIIFDEAHHLSKIRNQATTQRYRLAQNLREQTDAFVFLSGTPHQGDTEQFINLLLLLRPDLSQRLGKVFTDPSVISEIVLRNKKSLATDANGALLFHGQTSHRLEVPTSPAAIAFDRELQDYLKEGYAASDAGGTQSRAIGFVMTIYRKLASSSIAAIEGALDRRAQRLAGGAVEENTSEDLSDPEVMDALNDGTDGRDDLAQLADNIPAQAFFADELDQVRTLLVKAAAVKADDRKLQYFLDEVAAPLVKQDKKLLVFTEYRGTEAHLHQALEQRFVGAGIARLNGSMDLQTKRENIAAFNEHCSFMVSTEAGGEGINLHQQCHVMVNYDLPWNPSRLVQRAGRLYRYGQKEHVTVFNMVTSDSFDDKVLAMMLERVDNIAHDMESVGQDHQEVVGALLERLDMAVVLAGNRSGDLDRSAEEMAVALARAQDAQRQQEELFARVEGYDGESTIFGQFDAKDVATFLERVLPYKQIGLRNRLYDGNILELQLPDDMRERYADFGRSTVIRVVLNRQSLPLTAARDVPTTPLDFASAFFRDMIEFAESLGFGGTYAMIPATQAGLLALYRLRWQDDQGVPRQEALLPVFLPDGADTAVPNPAFFHDFLLSTPGSDGASSASGLALNEERLELAKRCAEEELAARCTERRHPNDVVLLACAELYVQ